MPLIRPATWQLNVVGVAGVHPPLATPPGEVAVVTVYPVTGEPFATDAVQNTVTRPLARTPPTPVGAPGTVPGVTAGDGVEGVLVPIPFAAVTVKV